MNLQALVFDQLSYPSYQDLFKYSRRKTGPKFDRSELSKFPPANSNLSQFGKDRRPKCHICGKQSILRCSDCGKSLCLDHFLEGTCFHFNSTQRVSDFVRHLNVTEDDLDDDELYEFD